MQTPAIVPINAALSVYVLSLGYIYHRDYETFKCVSDVFVKKIHDSIDICGLFNLAHIRITIENLKKEGNRKK